MKKFISMVFNRIFFTALFMAVQIFAVVYVVTLFREKFTLFYIVCILISAALVVHVINMNSNPAYKIAWIIPIVLLPVFGTLLYLMFGKNRLPKWKKERMQDIQNKYDETMKGLPSSIEKLRAENEDAALQAGYIEKVAAVPVFEKTETLYLESGEVMFEHMLEELQKAKRFIFLEYFIIRPGEMWDSILAILEEKVKAGLDVRVLYDDLGCIFNLSSRYFEILEAKGIRCCPFNRLVPILSSRFNNRDHRKICVIDGVVGFTGGVNLADEYINAFVRHGHWQDCGIMLRGDAVWSFTVMFLSMWGFASKTRDDFLKFRPSPEALESVRDDGYVMPFTDTPIDDEAVGETVYMNMISRAKRYVYICTPYLVIDNEMVTCLTAAAKSGIDVRIIVPHIPDKKLVHALTRSFYEILIANGVKVYEYTPGFMHSKTFLCDDEYGVVGSINLDYRSLYLHYECAAWLYGCSALAVMKAEYLGTLEKCEEITLEWCLKVEWYKRLGHSILRAFAPIV
ncbi:MAG: cardiolipin synthase [Oscillospiraceae bacterium]